MVKSEILKVFERNRGQLISGGKLAEELNVSRTSVWKQVEELRKEGYDIISIPHKGYMISNKNDLISAEGIGNYLDKENSNIKIYAYKTLKSTNETAKRLALDGASHGTVVISEEQTAGKGRLGRKFYSPSNSGIYMSIILRPELKASDSVLITTAVSVAVCKAIEKLTDIKPGIKWINDIIIDNKKVCGILTEAVTDFETGNIQNVILGIGINFNTPENGFPEDIKDTAASLFADNKNEITRNQLSAEIINQVFFILKDIKNCDFIDEYKKRSVILNKDITFISEGITYRGKAIDINRDGSLVVYQENNEIVTLNSGEITVRQIN